MFAMVDAVRLGHISDLHLRCHLSGTAAVSARRVDGRALNRWLRIFTMVFTTNP